MPHPVCLLCTALPPCLAQDEWMNEWREKPKTFIIAPRYSALAFAHAKTKLHCEASPPPHHHQDAKGPKSWIIKLHFSLHTFLRSSSRNRSNHNHRAYFPCGEKGRLASGLLRPEGCLEMEFCVVKRNVLLLLFSSVIFPLRNFPQTNGACDASWLLFLLLKPPTLTPLFLPSTLRTYQRTSRAANSNTLARGPVNHIHGP